MDQADLVKSTGFHKSTISRLASGIQSASIAQIEEISEALGVNKELFLSDKTSGASHATTEHSNYHQLLELIAAKDETIHALKMTINALKKP